MPKRARCPHCDRLFNRDKLDEHIHRCRARHERKSEHRLKPSQRTIIVDGNNVAFYLSPDKIPRVGNLSRAYQSLLNAGYKPIIIVSAALKHRIDKPEHLQQLISLGQIVEAPRGRDDDLEIIQTARDKNANIVSNDRFLNWIVRFPWLSARLIRYRMTPAGLILA